jgi:hypothetical protein
MQPLLLRSAHFWDFAQRRMAVSGQPVLPQFKGQVVQKDGTGMLTRNVDKKLLLYGT